MALHDPVAASRAFQKGLELEPNNKTLRVQEQRSRAQAEYEAQCTAAHWGLHWRDLVLKLRAVSTSPPECLQIFPLPMLCDHASPSHPIKCRHELCKSSTEGLQAATAAHLDDFIMQAMKMGDYMCKVLCRLDGGRLRTIWSASSGRE